MIGVEDTVYTIKYLEYFKIILYQFIKSWTRAQVDKLIVGQKVDTNFMFCSNINKK